MAVTHKVDVSTTCIWCLFHHRTHIKRVYMCPSITRMWTHILAQLGFCFFQVKNKTVSPSSPHQLQWVAPQGTFTPLTWEAPALDTQGLCSCSSSPCVVQQHPSPLVLFPGVSSRALVVPSRLPVRKVGASGGIALHQPLCFSVPLRSTTPETDLHTCHLLSCHHQPTLFGLLSPAPCRDCSRHGHR